MTFIRDDDGRVVMHISEAEQVYPQGPPALRLYIAHCDECNSVHSFEKCPWCYSWITNGFGLMGGGFGSYQFCNNESCGWFRKDCLPLDEC